MNLAPILDAHGVAELLKCSPRTVEDRARAGTLPGVKVGESGIFPTAALLEAVNEMARANTQRECARPAAVAMPHARKAPPVLWPIPNFGDFK